MLLSLAGCALRPSGAPRCGAVRACSPTVYTPFLESMFAIFAEYGIELEPYPVAEELRHRSVTSGSAAKPRKVELSLQAHRSAKLRHIRAAHIQGGDGLQVLNICLFPHLEFALPTFSADLVTLPGGHLIAIDCQPNDPSAPPDTDSERLARLYTEHRQRLPDGGPVANEVRVRVRVSPNPGAARCRIGGCRAAWRASWTASRGPKLARFYRDRVYCTFYARSHPGMASCASPSPRAPRSRARSWSGCLGWHES